MLILLFVGRVLVIFLGMEGKDDDGGGEVRESQVTYFYVLVHLYLLVNNIFDMIRRMLQKEEIFSA